MGAQLWERQEKAAYQRREDSLYTLSSFPSSLFTTTSPIPLSVSASARTNPAHLKELKLCKHLVEYLRLVPSETHPRSPTGLPTWWKHQDFFFFQAFSPQKKGKKKKEKLQSKRGLFMSGAGTPSWARRRAPRRKTSNGWQRLCQPAGADGRTQTGHSNERQVGH